MKDWIAYLHIKIRQIKRAIYEQVHGEFLTEFYYPWPFYSGNFWWAQENAWKSDREKPWYPLRRTAQEVDPDIPF
jgi:hypothetical protein